MRNVHFLRSSSLLIAAALLTACCDALPRPSSATRTPQNVYADFQTAVAENSDRQFDVYWLGAEFEAGGLRFTGPYSSAPGWTSDDDQLDTGYGAKLGPRAAISLQVSLFSHAGWERYSKLHAEAMKSGKHRTVSIQGQDADLFTLGSATRPVNFVSLAIDLGDTVAYASTHSGGSAVEGGPDVNPLVDEATFLSVMEQLRPYPE